MSWLPAFRFGLWNAWVLMLIFPLQPHLLRVVDKAVGTGDIFKKMGEAPTDKGQKRANMIFMVIQWALYLFSIFLPLKLGTPWFYAGLATYLAGLGMLLAAMVNAAAAPAGQIFSGGMYRWSRHPAYLAMSLVYSAVGVAAAAWIFLCLAAVLVLLLRSQALVEEHECLVRYGNEYREYMHKTPRWLGIPRSN
jgi:protein-S-isoprenylcysteine O-methyltransferase Ste14